MKKSLFICLILICLVIIIVLVGLKKRPKDNPKSDVTPSPSEYEQKRDYKKKQLAIFPEGSIKNSYDDFCYRMEMTLEEWEGVKTTLKASGWAVPEYDMWEEYPIKSKLFSEEEEKSFTDQMVYKRIDDSLSNMINYVTEYVGIMMTDENVLVFYCITFTQGRSEIR